MSATEVTVPGADFYCAAVFTAGNLVIGSIAALVVGLSKTALPGAALLATPLFAAIVTGRLIPGATLPVLIFADLFAVGWYRRHARWDLLRPMVAPVAVGFAFGTAFFVGVGNSTRVIDVVIGTSILLIVTIQGARLARRRPPASATANTALAYGAVGGFTTFVANAAGPVMTTYLASLGFNKREMVGTNSWFYFSVNLAKVPVYLALGALTTGGHFFTGESLLFDAALLPGVLIGVFAGRKLLPHIPERGFLIAVLALSAAGALKLLLGA